MRAAALVALAACGVEMSAPSDWVAIGDVHGELAAFAGDRNLRVLPVTKQLRVVTYNIKDGGVDPHALAAALLADPELRALDVLFVQEAVAYPEEGVPRIEALADALGMAWVYVPARRDRDGTLGNAILSRFPIRDAHVMQLAVATRRRQRIAIRADLQIGDALVPVVTAHLDVSLNIANRIRQVRPAVIDLPDTAIVGGDFNTNPYAWQEGEAPLVATSQIVDTDQAIAFDDYMAAIGFANPTAALGTTAQKYGIDARLDAFYVRGVTAAPGGVRRSIDLSDHWPVWIDVTLE